MRLVPLLALCLALPALAQAPPPESFYPLAVGDVREYRGTGPASSPYPRYTSRESVVGDTLAGGVTYWLVERLYLEDGQPLVRSRHAVRFDTASARPVERLPDGTEAPRALCRLDLADPMCASDLGEEPVQIGSDVTERAVRSAYNIIATERYASGIGLVSRDTDDGADYVERLTFARLGGQTYGTPNAVLSNDGTPPAPALALTAAPNPTVGAATLTLSLPAPARITVEAFDALGRRVRATETDASAGETRLDVDARRWAPGVYVVRATTDGGASATTRLVRR